uniref:Uncharacterized protein n=1 Tax=Cacopsylla melanoneura TaxID=428564 RepID=A0A8D8PPQ4_9HEMI
METFPERRNHLHGDISRGKKPPRHLCESTTLERLLGHHNLHKIQIISNFNVILKDHHHPGLFSIGLKSVYFSVFKVSLFVVLNSPFIKRWDVYCENIVRARNDRDIVNSHLSYSQHSVCHGNAIERLGYNQYFIMYQRLFGGIMFLVPVIDFDNTVLPVLFLVEVY